VNMSLGDFTDYYRVLQVHPEADPELIKKAYKLLCQRWHPDVCSESKEKAHEKMILINSAFEVLSDSRHRREYDLLYDEYNQRVYVEPSFSSTAESEDYYLTIHSAIHNSREKSRSHRA
jgi:molecular chaperone DnaJ